MTHHEQLHKAARMGRQLRHEPLTYVESIAHQDRPVLEEILGCETVKGTVLRMFLGASECLPARALTGLISAAHTAMILPVEQLQVISVTSVGETINGTPRIIAKEQFERFAGIGTHILRHTMPEVVDKLIFAEDSFSPEIDSFRPLVEQHLKTAPALHRELARMGEGRRADFTRYTAAHVVNQDTAALELQPLHTEANIVSLERVIAIGGQKERVFHAARLGVRKLIEPEMLIPSVQLFTHHTVPSYFMAKQGEQALDDMLMSRQFDFAPADPQARRDMQQFMGFLQPGAHHA